MSIDVITVLGFKRVGSTLVHNCIGQEDHMVSLGEIRDLRLKLDNNGICGCGELLTDCSFWKGIIDDAGYPPPKKYLQDRYFFLLLLCFFIKPLRSIISAELNYYTKFFTILKEKVSPKIVVDSSKSISFFILLKMIPIVSVQGILVVRNPISVLHSFEKRKKRNHPLFKNYNPIKAVIEMDIQNFLSMIVLFLSQGSFSLVLFESFIGRPIETLSNIRINGFKEIKRIQSPEMEMIPTHSIGGSPSRYLTGNIKLENDSLSDKRSFLYLLSFTGWLYLLYDFKRK